MVAHYTTLKNAYAKFLKPWHFYMRFQQFLVHLVLAECFKQIKRIRISRLL